MPLLDLTDISKNFGAIQALNNVSLTLEHGEVVGLMGDTGAGKSTLMRITGNFPPTQGTITIDGGQPCSTSPLRHAKPAWRSSIRTSLCATCAHRVIATSCSD